MTPGASRRRPTMARVAWRLCWIASRLTVATVGLITPLSRALPAWILVGVIETDPVGPLPHHHPERLILGGWLAAAMQRHRDCAAGAAAIAHGDLASGRRPRAMDTVAKAHRRHPAARRLDDEVTIAWNRRCQILHPTPALPLQRDA